MERERCDICYGTGRIITCCDDLCQDGCMHGDGEHDCHACEGEGHFGPEEHGDMLRERDPYADLVAANISLLRDVYGKGLAKARRALERGDAEMAKKVIDAALAFHPMHGEDWPGWPDETSPACQEAP